MVLFLLLLAAGIGVAGQALGSFMLSNEMLGPKWRGVAGILLQVGLVSLAVGMAMFGGKDSSCVTYCFTVWCAVGMQFRPIWGNDS
jgi:hypothetical protein